MRLLIVLLMIHNILCKLLSKSKNPICIIGKNITKLNENTTSSAENIYKVIIIEFITLYYFFIIFTSKII